MTHKFFYWLTMAMKFLTIIKYLIGYIVSITEYKYSAQY